MNVLMDSSPVVRREVNSQMAGNQNRRRKKIEAHKAKRKEKQRAIARVESPAKVVRMMQAQAWPVLEAWIAGDLKKQGIANVYMARRGPHDQVAGAIFLVDVFCLGVKDVVVYLGPEWNWKDRLQTQRERGQNLEKISPEAVRKLVEGAVQYARSLGIEPHRDYLNAAPIFGNLDAANCSTEFVFGCDGKPRFITGPFDTAERVQKILNILESRVGKDKYDFVLMSGGFDDFDRFDEDDEEEEDLDDGEFDDELPNVIDVAARKIE